METKKTAQKKTAAKRTPRTAKAETVKKPKAAPSAGALSAPVYNTLGKEVGTIALPGNVFGARFNADLVHQVVTSMQSNARAGRGLAHTKDRSEVRGGGKKPWRQKGTGRARHGSSRSPIWVGGGVTHGPRTDKDYSRRVPKGMRTTALYATLSQKLKSGQVLFVDSITFKEPKTAEGKNILENLAKISGFETLFSKKNNAALIALSSNNTNAKKSFANLGNIAVEEVRNLNPIDLLSATVVIIENPEESVKQLAKVNA